MAPAAAHLKVQGRVGPGGKRSQDRPPCGIDLPQESRRRTESTMSLKDRHGHVAVVVHIVCDRCGMRSAAFGRETTMRRATSSAHCDLEFSGWTSASTGEDLCPGCAASVRRWAAEGVPGGPDLIHGLRRQEPQ